MSKSGHAFMKDVMREADAVYGGEMSAHHYFRALRLLRQRPDSLAAGDAADVANPARRCRSWSASASRSFPASGEINRKVADAKATIAARRRSATSPARARSTSPTACRSSSTDWRFNLRSSNTEPLIRLNVESRGDAALMQAKTAELLELIGGEDAH